MITRRWLLLAFAAIVLAALLWPALRQFLATDKCLDAGGAWNKTTRQCLAS